MTSTSSQRTKKPWPSAISQKDLRLAQVGWTGSGADKRRFEDYRQWMHDNVSAHSKHNEPGVKFDLSYQGDANPLYGSDFLLDTRTFEIVILHHLFIGWDELDTARKPTISEHFGFAISPKQSPEKWRRRLAKTGAKFIFAFGANFEVASSYLLAIPGYQKIITSFGAVYLRSLESSR